MWLKIAKIDWDEGSHSWDQTTIYEGWLRDIPEWVSGQKILLAEETQKYNVGLTLWCQADNSVQNKTAIFDFVVNATTEGT